MNKNHPQYKHGMSKHRIYGIWNGVYARCYNMKTNSYKTYGARGIKMSKRWKANPMNFINDMKDSYFEGATLDRIDNNKGYSKENCRWATIVEQARNKKSVTLYAKDGSDPLPVDEWDKILGFKTGTVRARIKRGWSVEKSLSEPKKKYEGVFFDRRGKWQARINKKYVGRFDSKEKALEARKKALLYDLLVNGK